MKKVKTIVLDLTLALGLLVVTGVATGVLPVSSEGADIFGGGTCDYYSYGPWYCSGSASGCVYTVCKSGNYPTTTTYSSFYRVPCGVYSCGTCARIVTCVSGT